MKICALLVCFLVVVAVLPASAKYATAEEVSSEPYDSLSNDPGFFSCISKNKKEAQDQLSDYTLYTNKDPGNAISFDNNCQEFSTAFNNGEKTFLIIHGFKGKPQCGWVLDMKNELLKKELGANVIAVGWQKAAAGLLNYDQAAEKTRPIGTEVANFLQGLLEQNSPDKFYLIGHSLGAQISGFAGKEFQRISNRNIGRITGLDPAAPKFEGKDAKEKLNANDADFVDVIHTDTISGVYHLGTRDKSGKFDFWPNGGNRQPGCGKASVTCSHSRAHQFFIESINSDCSFSSYRSQSWANFQSGNRPGCGNTGKEKCPEMGYNAINYKDLVDGDFYLETNAQAPYCTI